MALPLTPDLAAARWQETVAQLAFAVEREAERQGLTVEELAARWEQQAAEYAAQPAAQ